jgi:hypothetical protein
MKGSFGRLAAGVSKVCSRIHTIYNSILIRIDRTGTIYFSKLRFIVGWSRKVEGWFLKLLMITMTLTALLSYVAFCGKTVAVLSFEDPPIKSIQDFFLKHNLNILYNGVLEKYEVSSIFSIVGILEIYPMPFFYVSVCLKMVFLL